MRLSFIVPVYRTESLLPRCVDSLLAQTERDFELILVDDGSPDSCPEICDRYAARDARVRVIHQKNAGVVSARDRGLDAATGEYVCFVDSDDIVSPRLAERLTACMVEKPDILVFRYSVIAQTGEEDSCLHFSPGYYGRDALDREILSRFISDRTQKPRESGLTTVVWDKAFRREFLLQWRFREEGIALGEDAALCFLCVLHADSLYVLDEVLYRYDKTNPIAVTQVYRPDLLPQFARLIGWMDRELGHRTKQIDRQLNDYYARRLLRAVFIEVQHKRPLAQAAKTLRQGFRETGVLKYVRVQGLGFAMGTFILMLRLRAYALLLLLLRAASEAKNALQKQQSAGKEGAK